MEQKKWKEESSIHSRPRRASSSPPIAKPFCHSCFTPHEPTRFLYFPAQETPTVRTLPAHIWPNYHHQSQPSSCGLLRNGRKLFWIREWPFNCEIEFHSYDNDLGWVPYFSMASPPWTIHIFVRSETLKEKPTIAIDLTRLLALVWHSDMNLLRPIKVKAAFRDNFSLETGRLWEKLSPEPSN